MSHQKQDASQLASSGITWNLIEQVGVAGITLTATVILSRILGPEDFGLFGMPVVLSNLATLVVTMGLNYSVIQNKSLTEQDFDSMFWLSMFSGLSIAALFFFGAPLVSKLYNQPSLVPLTRLLSIVFIIQGASAVPLGILIKRMDFKSLAIAQLIASSLSYTTGIVLAFYDFSYWALIAQVIVFNATLVSLNLFFSRWRPALHFHAASLAKVKTFSAHFTGNQVLEFASNNLDAFLVGKYLGSRNLGLMGRALGLSMMPVTSFGFILNRTFFPWFSSLQDQPDELRLRYLQSSKALALVMLPLLALLAIASEEVVRLLFGVQWSSLVPLLRVFCLYAAVNCMNLFHDSFLTSQGRTDLLIRINLVEKVLLVVGVIAGLVTFGISGVVWAKTSVTCLFFFPRLIVACHRVSLPIGSWFSELRGIAISLLAAVLSGMLFKTTLPVESVWVRLILIGGIPLMLYYMTLRLLKESSLEMIQHLIVGQLKDLRSRGR